MKTLIILLACIACLVGCKEKKDTKRYFFIGYTLNQLESHGFTSVGSPISIGEVKKIVIDNWACQGDYYTTGQIVVTSYHEFKDSAEYNYFVQGSDYVPYCKSSDAMPVTSDQSLSLPADSVKLGGTLTPNTTINKKAWTDASKATRDTMVITTSTGYYSLAVDSLGNVIDTPRKDGVIRRAIN